MKLFLILPMLLTCAFGKWHMYKHNDIPHNKIVSGTAFMPSSTTKLFALATTRRGSPITRLWERIFTNGKWQWVNHYAPSLQREEHLLSTPCVLSDGKLFVITNHGRLVERFWDGHTWKWVIHGKPSRFKWLSTIKCVATHGNGLDRVIMVGTDGNVYERLWRQGAWRWWEISSPVGIRVSFTVMLIFTRFSSKALYAPGNGLNDSGD